MTAIDPKQISLLLEFFPEVSPPLVLSEDLALTFSEKNTPIPMDLIVNTISQWEEIDEYTEIIPCLSLIINDKHKAIIYWKGSLLSYQYTLITIAEEKEIVSRKIIAGTISNGLTIKKSVANIDEDLVIHSMVGESDVNEKYNPHNSKAYSFEIRPDGQIATSEEYNNIWQKEIN